MRILVTGATGFVGSHFITWVQQRYPAADVIGTTLTSAAHTAGTWQLMVCDLRQRAAVLELVAMTQPDTILHLAGQASIAQSFDNAWETFQSNVQPLLNVIEGCLQLGITPRMLVITSAEVYGKVNPPDLPITEQTRLAPANPYSASKAAQDLMAQQYVLSHNLPILRARPFNHIGAGQSEQFVVTSFAMQIARIEAGLQEPIIRVGNLSSRRDFTDVRDVVRAYTLILEHGSAGDVYNIASGKTVAISEVLNSLLSMTTTQVTVAVDTERLRPVDVPIIQTDCRRLYAATGWQPVIPFDQTLRDVLDDCRQRVLPSYRSNTSA